MPTREHVTHQETRLALDADISSNTTTEGAIFDTANYDAGVYFALAATAWTDGLYTLKLEHGDNAALSDAAVVPTANLVYGSLPALAAAIADGAAYEREGVIGTKRYVRASIVSTGVTTGATINVVCLKDAELIPTGQ